MRSEESIGLKRHVTPDGPKRTSSLRWRIIRTMIALGILTFGIALPVRAADDPYDGRWHFALTPYIWLPNVNGNFKYQDFPAGPGSGAEAETESNGLLEHLTFALMISGEARKGPWAVVTDIILLDFSGQKSNLKSVSGPGGEVTIPRDQNVNTESSLSGGAWMLAGSYTIAKSDLGYLDVELGARYLGIKTSLDWNLATTISGPGITVQKSGTHSDRADLVDAIVGIRGRLRFGESWFMPYYLDVGTGASVITWQALGGIGYAFRWGDLSASYRTLFYDQRGDELLQNVRFSGPAFGVTFRF